MNAYKKTYYLTYTILFLGTAALVFSWYFLAGRTLIWETDGWRQHYKALVYYAKYLRFLLREILAQKKLCIPMWDFSIGEGSDILQTLHYYVIGDPLNIFAVFVPVRFLHLYYNAMILLRLYLAGIVFSKLCFQTGCQSRAAVLAGSLTYCFCFWAVYNAARHPFFLNPMICLPLLVIGAEKILAGQKPFCLILAVWLSAVSNFYFFYILAFLMVIYTLIRLFSIYVRKPRRLIFMLLRLGIAALLGLGMAAAIFFPMCGFFFKDARTAAHTTLRLFYPLSYYC